MRLYIPKTTPYKKYHKGKRLNKIFNYSNLNIFKQYKIILVARDCNLISSKQLITLYQTINKRLKKRGKIIICFYAHRPRTKKPNETRMGKGKGNIDSWIAKVQKGSIICEVHTIYIARAIKALTIVQKKLPFKSKIVKV